MYIVIDNGMSFRVTANPVGTIHLSTAMAERLIDDLQRGIIAAKCMCTTCGKHRVDAENGYDTCQECLRKQ